MWKTTQSTLAHIVYQPVKHFCRSTVKRNYAEHLIPRGTTLCFLRANFTARAPFRRTRSNKSDDRPALRDARACARGARTGGDSNYNNSRARTFSPRRRSRSRYIRKFPAELPKSIAVSRETHPDWPGRSLEGDSAPRRLNIAFEWRSRRIGTRPRQ